MKRYDGGILKNCKDYILIFILQFLVGISGPLIPLNYLINFGLIILRENPFAVNFWFSLLTLIAACFIGIVGILAPLFYIILEMHH